jgi:hypothetical protein
MGRGRAARVWIEPSGDRFAIWQAVRGTGYVRESDGAVLGQRTELLGHAPTRPLAHMLLTAAVDQTLAAYPGHPIELVVWWRSR